MFVVEFSEICSVLFTFTDEAKLFCQAEWLVESAIQSAVYQVYGYKDIHVFFTPIQQQGAAPANKKLHRQESAPCIISDLGERKLSRFDINLALGNVFL